MIIPILQLEKLRLSGHSCGLQWACPRPRREREGCLGPKFQVCLASEPLLIKITVDDVRPVTQSCQTLCYSMDCSLPGSYVRGISQARILEWVAISSPRGSFRPRDQTWVPASPALAVDSLPWSHLGIPTVDDRKGLKWRTISLKFPQNTESKIGNVISHEGGGKLNTELQGATCGLSRPCSSRIPARQPCTTAAMKAEEKENCTTDMAT